MSTVVSLSADTEKLGLIFPSFSNKLISSFPASDLFRNQKSKINFPALSVFIPILNRAMKFDIDLTADTAQNKSQS